MFVEQFIKLLKSKKAKANVIHLGHINLGYKKYQRLNALTIKNNYNSAEQVIFSKNILN